MLESELSQIAETIFGTSVHQRSSTFKSNNSIESLITAYEISSREVGIVTFFDVPRELPPHWIFGNSEANFLALNTESGRVVELDHADLSFQVCECATDADSFLRALAAFAEGLRTRDDDEQLFSRCVEIAGGEAFEGFYAALIL